MHVDTRGFDVARGWMTRKNEHMSVRVDTVEEQGVSDALVRLTITDESEGLEPVEVWMDGAAASAWRDALARALGG